MPTTIIAIFGSNGLKVWTLDRHALIQRVVSTYNIETSETGRLGAPNWRLSG